MSSEKVPGDKLVWVTVNNSVTEEEMINLSEAIDSSLGDDINPVVTTDEIKLLDRGEVLNYLDDLHEAIQNDDRSDDHY